MKDIIYRVPTISDLHEIAGFEKPRHPMISVVDYSKVNVAPASGIRRYVLGFYSINFKRNCHFHYGRLPFDHQEGTLLCTAPEQVITFDSERDSTGTEGWGLHFHPELLGNSDLGRKIHEYSFFAYAENEALHLSELERTTLFSIVKQLENEYNTYTDTYSHALLISHLELLLNYCRRFYGRQFITRTIRNRDVIARFEEFLSCYFNSPELKNNGIPTVSFCADKMNLSANYFSDLLRSETGKNAQDHIHSHLLEKARLLLMGSDKSINEIAYELGFEYPQNFSKLFRKKTGSSPTEFRNETFNN